VLWHLQASLAWWPKPQLNLDMENLPTVSNVEEEGFGAG
jgi:hypothetical protein